MRRLLALFLLALPVLAQQPDVTKQLESQSRRNDRSFEDTQRMVDDVIWYSRLGDIANIDKFEIASSKPRREKNATGINAGNAVIFPVDVFSPKNLKGKAPMLVFAHGGVHGRLTTNYAHIFREGLERGFVIVSPEYRGSIGHGGDLFQGAGDFNKLNLAWLNWWLKGDEGPKGKEFLVGDGCVLCKDKSWETASVNVD